MSLLEYLRFICKGRYQQQPMMVGYHPTSEYNCVQGHAINANRLPFLHAGQAALAAVPGYK